MNHRKLHGKESYCAVCSSYAAQFSNQAAVEPKFYKMVRYMFLCAVKVGDYHFGLQESRRSPSRPNETALVDLDHKNYEDHHQDQMLLIIFKIHQFF